MPALRITTRCPPLQPLLHGATATFCHALLCSLAGLCSFAPVPRSSHTLGCLRAAYPNAFPCPSPLAPLRRLVWDAYCRLAWSRATHKRFHPRFRAAAAELLLVARCGETKLEAQAESGEGAGSSRRAARRGASRCLGGRGFEAAEGPKVVLGGTALVAGLPHPHLELIP